MNSQNNFQNSNYTSAGRSFAGYLAVPASGRPAPGVLVCHEGSGLNDFARGKADAIAALGYLAYAADLFGETLTSREQGSAFIRALVASGLRARVADAHAHLKSISGVDSARTAAIGFCFGGLAALELARSGADVSCVVSFHGGLQAPVPAKTINAKCRILICTGGADPFAPREARAAFEDEMNALGADWTMTIYAGALHGFTNKLMDPNKSPGCAYHAAADHRSWQAMRDLFEESMGSVFA